MSETPAHIRLTSEQVEAIVRAAREQGGGSVVVLLPDPIVRGQLPSAVAWAQRIREDTESRLSLALARGLLLLARLAEGSPASLTELAGELDMLVDLHRQVFGDVDGGGFGGARPGHFATRIGAVAVPRTGPPIPRVLDGEVLPSIPTLLEPRYSQSLERGLAILECFTPAEPVLGIADLADRLGMSRSTTHRYVITLVALGYLRQIENRKYRLGLAVVGLGCSAMSSTPLAEHARPYLEELRSRTGFVVSLAVLDGPEVLLVDRLRGSSSWSAADRLRSDVGVAAAGVLHRDRQAVCSRSCPRMSCDTRLAKCRCAGGPWRTITSKTALHEALEKIRAASLVCAEGEQAEGLLSIAAPVREHSGEVVAAVGMDAHESMISLGDLAGPLGPHLIAAADRVSARLGYRREDELRDGAVSPVQGRGRSSGPVTIGTARSKSVR